MPTDIPLCSGSSGDFSSIYDLQGKIGQGTFSEVWRCVRRNGGQEYAAKILKKEYGSDMDEKDWLAISEVDTAKSLENHPFLLMVLEGYHERDTGKVVLFAELMKRSLYDVIAAGECPLPENRIKTYTYQMLEGLKYLHENGFMHRDIKPENVLLGQRDKVLKIGDLGTACRVSAAAYPYAEYVATRWYRSPECLLTRGWYGTKMDVWAAGCVLFEMATGRPMFDGRDEAEQMRKIDEVLGWPDGRLIDRLRKHKSDVLVNRYEKGAQTASPGIGLSAVYQPYRPSHEVLKDMIVYDPNKRLSADRLLRKTYFYDIRNTQFEYKMREFEFKRRNLETRPPSAKTTNSAKEEEEDITSKPSLANKKQGPDGDRESAPGTKRPAENGIASERRSGAEGPAVGAVRPGGNRKNRSVPKAGTIGPKKPAEPSAASQDARDGGASAAARRREPRAERLDYKNVSPKVDCWLNRDQSAASLSTLRRASVRNDNIVRNVLAKRPIFK